MLRLRKKKSGFMLSEVLLTVSIALTLTFTASIISMSVINSVNGNDSLFKSKNELSGVSVQIRENVNSAKYVNVEAKKLTLIMLDGSTKVLKIIDGEEGYLLYNNERILNLLGETSEFSVVDGMVKVHLNVRVKTKGGAYKGDEYDLKIAIRY